MAIPVTPQPKPRSGTLSGYASTPSVLPGIPIRSTTGVSMEQFSLGQIPIETNGGTPPPTDEGPSTAYPIYPPGGVTIGWEKIPTPQEVSNALDSFIKARGGDPAKVRILLQQGGKLTETGVTMPDGTFIAFTSPQISLQEAAMSGGAILLVAAAIGFFIFSRQEG